MPFPFEFSVPEAVEGVFDGSLNATVFAAFHDPDDLPATNVIQTSQPWGVRVDWEIHGNLLWLNLNEAFELSLFIESIGPGPEMRFPPAPVQVLQLSVPVIAGARTYTRNINVPAFTLPAGEYKVVTLVQWAAIGNTPKYDVAGMVEQPILNIIAVP